MPFTTWSALKTTILNDIADNSFRTKSYSINGRSHAFQDMREVREFLQLCDQMTMAGTGVRENLVTFKRPD